MSWFYKNPKENINAKDGAMSSNLNLKKVDIEYEIEKREKELKEATNMIFDLTRKTMTMDERISSLNVQLDQKTIELCNNAFNIQNINEQKAALQRENAQMQNNLNFLQSELEYKCKEIDKISKMMQNSEKKYSIALQEFEKELEDKNKSEIGLKTELESNRLKQNELQKDSESKRNELQKDSENKKRRIYNLEMELDASKLRFELKP